MIAPQRPKVSVLLPCRDVERYLPACIASLEAQTEQRFEVLAVDDGSRDGTRGLLVEWAESDARVRLFEPDGRGIIAALRRLESEARAPLLARMDGDDTARPERLRAQLELLGARPDVAACGTGVRYTPRPAARSGYRRYESWLNGLREPEQLERDLFVECPIAHPTLMVRRTAFDAAGGYRVVDGPEDYDLILRLAAGGARLANVGDVLHDWRLGDGRLSERSARYAPEAFRRLKVAFLTAGVVPEDRPLFVWGAGKVGKAFARTWIEAGGSVAAFVDLDPRKIGQRIHDAQVIGPSDPRLQTGGSGLRAERPYVLAAVGSPGARDEIRAALDALGYLELEDYRAVA